MTRTGLNRRNVIALTVGAAGAAAAPMLLGAKEKA